MGKLHKLPSFLSNVKGKLPKISVSKEPLFDDETLEWLLNEPNDGCGEKLVKEAQKILDDKKGFPREKLVRNLTVYNKNWKIAMGEIKRLEEEVKKLEVQAKILRE